MRNIEVKEWIVIDAEKKEHKEDLLMLLSLLVTNKKPDELPRGFEQFKLFRKLTVAFEKATESRVLVLEEDVYKFLKSTVETSIPSIWGTNKNIVEAINLFMESREE